MQLRPYQSEAIEALWEELKTSPTALLVLPTGTGKTHVLQNFILKALQVKPDFKCAFLVNRTELLRQTARIFSQNLPTGSVSVFRPINKHQTAVTVATIQSISKHAGMFNLIIADETHNLNESDGQYKKMIDQCFDLNPRLKIIGVTATPYRATGLIYGDNKLFKRICYHKTLEWAQENGYLVPLRLKHTPHKFDVSALDIRMGDYVAKQVNKLTLDENKMLEQLKDALPQLEGRKKIVWACSCIQHAENLMWKIREITRDSVSIVHSKLKEDFREMNMQWFAKGEGRHLVFVSAISEGVDVPCIDAVVLMRPTRSPVLMVQIIGRGLRLYPGKRDLIVLDYGSIIEHIGTPYNPLVKSGRAKKDLPDVKMKFCQSCLEYVTMQTKVCPACNAEFPKHTIEDDRLKNLNTKSYTGEPTWINVRRILTQSNYKSKNGNDCLVIEYHLESIAPRIVHEYFPKNQTWAKGKFWKRLYSMGVTALTSVSVAVDAKISIRKSGAHYEVIEVRKRDTDRNIGLA